MAEMTRAAPAMDSEFTAEFARRLREQTHAMALPLMWLEHRLAEQAVMICRRIDRNDVALYSIAVTR